MKREIKFRAWDRQKKEWIFLVLGRTHVDCFLEGGKQDGTELSDRKGHLADWCEYTGLKDKNGKEIYEGDVVEFSDKWEWYRSSYGIKMHFADKEAHAKLKAQYDAEPMERREVKIPDCYDEFANDDLKNYWEIIGNVYETPELLTT